MAIDALTDLQTFITRLLYRHREIQEHLDEDLSLVFAEALLRHATVRPSLQDYPGQVVVIGPTQAGKSTIVNVLLDKDAAVPSPLAGYTRHAQGFTLASLEASTLAATDALLAELDRVPQAAIADDKLDAFSLTSLGGNEPSAAERIVWDTPDFDSVSSRSYRSTVPLLCAMADLVILVVSKDKYADQSVWETLRLITQVPRPLLVCVNKVPEEAREEFKQIIKDKFAEQHIHYSDVFIFPYLSGSDDEALRQSVPAAALREQVTTLLQPLDLTAQQPQLADYLQRHWDEWTDQAKIELAAKLEWQAKVDEILTETANRYEQEYLQKPHYADTLRRAILHLLELLELPGFAKGLARARQAITWPARTLTSMFLKKQRSFNEDEAPKVDNEIQILDESLEHALVSLTRFAGESAADADSHSREWWQQLWQHSSHSEALQQGKADEWIENHRVAFDPYIELAAQRLFEHLQEHPAKLNALRATRATADAAAVALALKTGGIGLNDLILAPAMLSFTSMLTEGALGTYMDSVENDLKQQQQSSVDEHILQPLKQALYALPNSMSEEGLLNLSQEDLTTAESALEKIAP